MSIYQTVQLSINDLFGEKYFVKYFIFIKWKKYISNIKY